jgi:hypothetical protein
MDRDAFLPAGASTNEQVNRIVDALECSARDYPIEERRDFQVLFGSRLLDGMGTTFEVAAISFSRGKATDVVPLDTPKTSDVITVLGSGSKPFDAYLSKWRSSDKPSRVRIVL